MIPSAPLEWFDESNQGIVLLFGDAGRHSTQAWLEARRAERGGRQLRVDAQEAAAALRHARRWDIDSLFCDDCTDGTMLAAAFEAAAEGALVVLKCRAHDVVDGMRNLLNLVGGGVSERCLGLLSRHLRLAISERAVARADGQGTVAAFEVLQVTPAQRYFIRDNRIHQLPAQMAVGGRTGARWWPDEIRQGMDMEGRWEAREGVDHG